MSFVNPVGNLTQENTCLKVALVREGDLGDAAKTVNPFLFLEIRS
jgi:hypothetical protein